jgi:quinol monooxygenase YgiN
VIRHIVLFQLRPDVSDIIIADLMAHFEALPAAIPEIEQLEVQRDIVGRPVSCHFGLVSQFADMDALRAYQQHPVHIAAFERTKEYLNHMLVLDYES